MPMTAPFAAKSIWLPVIFLGACVYFMEEVRVWHAQRARMGSIHDVLYT